MLEKHLTHLKNIQQMSRQIPRGPGIPPLSDMKFEQALMQNAPSGQLSLAGPSSQGSGGNGMEDNSNTDPIRLPSPFNMSSAFSLGSDQDDENKINPLAGMGLTDEQFNIMLQNMMAGDNFLGGLDVAGSAPGPSSPSGGGIMFGMGMPMGGSGVKRGYEDLGGGDMDAPQKKSRFEVIE